MQKHAISFWLKDHPNYNVIEFEDYAISGAERNRPALNAMIDLVLRRKLSMVVVYRLDRLSRSASDAIEIFLKFDRVGVDLVCIDQPLLSMKDNPFRRTMLTMFAELAEIERTILSSRIKEGIKAARARGVQFGPPKKLTPEIVEKIKALRKRGYSMRATGKELNISVGTVHRAVSL